MMRPWSITAIWCERTSASFWSCAAFAALIVLRNDVNTSRIAAAFAFAIGFLVILVAIIRRSTTELVLTDWCIITERGFISRDPVEMDLSKREVSTPAERAAERTQARR